MTASRLGDSRDRRRPLALYWDSFRSPVGTLAIVVDAHGRLTQVKLDGVPPRAATRAPAPCAVACRELEEYFAGERRAFALDLEPEGTDFQRRVWRALTDIPFGDVCNYGDIARRIGKPGASRAVGQANGANPIPIVIPCHRVIASDGAIGGYSGGVGIKERLLALEGRRLAA
jgi:methylated-DNA-[protein]-cysteine S-methyltransferase